MAQPKISIIIPIYNSAEYLDECLDSIVYQTFRDIEIICVNDGSADNSSEILEKFAAQDSRFRIIHRDSPSGSAALPRNIGLDLARGKYVMLLDSDDYFDETMLGKLYIRAEEIGADLVMCDNYVVSAPDNTISTKHTELHNDYLPKLDVFSYKDIPDTIFQISNAAVWHKLILRETLIQHDLKFQLNVPILDDIYFVNLLLVLSKRISIIRERLIFYRKNRHGAQTTKIGLHKESIFLAFSMLNKHLVENSIYDTVKLSLQNWTLKTMAWWLRSVSDYNAYSELYHAYKNDYFDMLNLMNIDCDDLYDNGIKNFYNVILDRVAKSSLMNILESILEPESSIALYGAGMVGFNTYNLIKSHGIHKIVLWCDMNVDKLSGIYNNPHIKHPKDLVSCEFDAVIIAIMGNDIVSSVKKYLSALGIESDKIYAI